MIMSKLSREQILKLALLSSLSLSDEEIVKYQNELGAILEYVAILEETNTDGLKPTYQVTGLENVTREDSVVESQQASPTDLMKIVPKSQDGYIKVGRMI